MRKIKELPKGTWKEGDKYCRLCPECDEILYYDDKYYLIYSVNKNRLCIICGNKKAGQTRIGMEYVNKKPFPLGTWERNNKFFRNCPKCNNIISHIDRCQMIRANENNSLCHNCLGKINSGENHWSYKPLLKGIWEKENMFFRNCPVCNIEISHKTKSSATRSFKNNNICRKCLGNKMMGKNNVMYGLSPKMPKPFSYKDLILRSSYELEFVKRLEYLNIKFEYEPKRFKLSNGKTYVPDFYLVDYDKWIEIKGLIRDYDLERHKLIQENYNINIEMINNLNKIKNFTI